MASIIIKYDSSKSIEENNKIFEKAKNLLKENNIDCMLFDTTTDAYYYNEIESILPNLETSEVLSELNGFIEVVKENEKPEFYIEVAKLLSERFDDVVEFTMIYDTVRDILLTKYFEKTVSLNTIADQTVRYNDNFTIVDELPLSIQKLVLQNVINYLVTTKGNYLYTISVDTDSVSTDIRII